MPSGFSRRAEEAGAEALVLCDTNGGTLPDEVERVVAEVRRRTSVVLGGHFHNDAGCAVANTLASVRRGRHSGAGMRERLVGTRGTP
ncbi:2-isopropylmalate synthase, partial [mine drainage metagenome]